MAQDFATQPVRMVEVEDIVPVLPAGIYRARFSLIETQRNDQGEYWKWTFVADHEGEEVEITATTSPRVTPRTKAAKWLAGMGVDVAVGAMIDFDSLIDQPVQIVVIIGDTGYSRIDSVLPAPSK